MSLSFAEKVHTYDPESPLARASTIPSCWYRDADVFEGERQGVFARCWLAAGLARTVAQPESFLTAEVAGEPILVVRDQESVLRAFHNVCRHRAAPVMTEPCGNATRLRCRYHGWTYDLAGRLRGVPEFDGVTDFRREDNGLVPLAVDSWGPFVWTHELPVRVPLLQFLDPLPRLLAGTGMERLQFVQRRDYKLHCNWKVFVDNYLDGGYHVHTVHPGLAGVLDYAAYRVEVADFTSTQISPLRPPASQESHAVGQVRGGDNAYYAFVFPNLMLNVYQGYADTNLVLPLGPDRCRVVFDYYFERTTGDEERVRQSIEVSHQIQLEDVGICEEVQRGLGSRAFQTGRYSVRREAAVHAFHQLLGRSLRAVV